MSVFTSKSGLAWVAVALTTWLGTPEAARASVRCSDLSAATLAAPGDAYIDRIDEVWGRMAGVAFGLTGLAAELRVVAPGGLASDGQPFPPNAVTCPEPAAQGGVAIYLTDTLVDLVFARERYPVDFLAFVLGHELGHRMNDLDDAGRPLKTPRGATPAFTGGGGMPPDSELLADVRGAYLASAAGYSIRRLSCDDCLNDYLRSEARLAPEIRLKRKDGLVLALRDFEAWETLYQAATALAFWGFGDEAVRVLAWADTETKRLAVPIPELDVLHALVLMMRAAEDAPWLDETRVPGAAVARLRCAPIYPAHSALSEDLATAEARRGDADTERAKRELLKARRLLKDAETMGASELVVASADACISLYLGQTKEAERGFGRARKLLPKDAAPGLVATLDANEALGAFIAVARGPLIAADDAAGWKVFVSELEKARPRFVKAPAIAALAKAIAAAGPGKAPTAESSASGCAASNDRDSSVLPALPKAPPLGGCPCGWVASGELRGEAASPDSPAVVTMCVPSGWGAGQRWLRVKLPGDGARDGVDVTMLLVDRLAGRLAAQATWEKSCDLFEHRGSSDQGDGIFAGQCQSLGLGNGVIIGSGSCKMDRAVILDL